VGIQVVALMAVLVDSLVADSRVVEDIRQAVAVDKVRLDSYS